MNNNKHWPRAIIHLDMNAFFASVEQQQKPELQGKPVAVTNGEQGTCIITSSYEAREFGIHTGMRLREARKLCKELIVVPAQPSRYALISRTIMQSLQNVTPDIEIFSVDEAFLDVTRCQKLLGTPETIARLAKQTVWEACGLPCSVGLSGDKTTAKYAAKLQKPDGLTIILPWQAKQRLANVPVQELCGIGKRTATFLLRYGIVNCGDMEKVPIGVIAKRFGNWGRRMWYMCQGMDPDSVKSTINAPKSMGHGKVVPPNTDDRETILTYFMHMSEKLCKRLRKNHMQAQTFYIGIKNYRLGWFAVRAHLIQPSNSNRLLFKLCKKNLPDIWQGEPICQVQITALDPQPENLQSDLFFDDNEAKQRSQLDITVDDINDLFGKDAIKPARLIDQDIGANVIAPAWKPDGHRQTIE